MRLFSSIVRLAMPATGVLVPWLLLTSVVDAAPPREVPTHWTRLVCDPRVPSRRALARMALPSATRSTVLPDVAARLQRSSTKTLRDDDDEAIQNDASAVGVEERRQMPTVLEPLGTLFSSHSPLRSYRTFSRRSPRGPPAF